MKSYTVSGPQILAHVISIQRPYRANPCGWCLGMQVMLWQAMSNAVLNPILRCIPYPDYLTLQVPGEASVTVRLAKSNAVLNLGVRLPEGAAGGITAGEQAEIAALVPLSSAFVLCTTKE